ncbi:transcription factor HIVEP3 [Alligator mississippiensis]|uniref:Transcription factor HIVEP3 n=1 Tax=Alligator mississippiensis TaxID=8496 RepID=A0A151PGW0_ALLMI|nr:transcription factor HIVEP3 [Alligator mississippiensis]
MLKRQPAIELPLGVEYGSEEVSSISKETVSKPAEEQESKESDVTKKSRKGQKVKGFMYECNICGARYKKRDNYEAHKKYYCSELQISKSRSSSSHTSSETEKNVVDPDSWPQMMHYKLGTSLELTPLRKRRKEKSLGDDEDPPAFEVSETPSSSSGSLSQFASRASSDVALNLTRESIKSPADPGKSIPPSEVSTGFHSRTTKTASSTEGKERRTTSKEISVIQHTSSFEKSDSIEQLSGLEEEKPLSQYSSQSAPQHSRPSHSLQPKLVRQPNIQVPEILVTEEPDRPENEPEPPPKEVEKTEEFQWPQRSQTLSQLPAEKLPPKKKRLRLAEMAQSSGESSFESVSLTRSPSQESSISHGSTHSISFDREEYIPVRIQTNMPSYGSAMYTTLSQILVTQSQCSSSSIVLPKFDDRQPKSTLVCSADVHGIGFDLAQMITEDQRSIFQSPYLRVPLPLPERKGYMPLTSPSESVLGLEGGPSTVSGSKRMLSPAGSLELTMETQQQKRVKEEEVSEVEEKLEVVKPPGTIEEGKKQDTSHFLAESQGRVEVETPPNLSLEQSEPKEIPSNLQPALPHSGASSFEALEEYKQPGGKQLRSKAPLQTVKKEDSKELAEHLPPNPPSPAPQSDATQSAMKSQEGISTKAALSLLRSKQKVSKETYTMATAPRPESGRLVPSSSRKPKMTEVHLPSLLSSEGRKDVTRAEKEEDKRGKSEEDAPITKRGEPARIKIFEGGYKSNEEYVYVRGRGRGKYVCEECGIRCKKPSMLKKHIRTHTDVRPYVCKYCNFAFKTKGNLTKHMKSKAHSKKCQEMGVLVSSLVDLEAEEGTSEDLFHDSEGREGSEPIEEHQFSDLEESDDDDDNEDDEDEEGEESQDEPPLKLFFGKNIELYESKLKIEPRSPTCSPGITQPVCSRPLQAPHDIHVHTPSRVEENVFSHLPLHSQQLTRTPYPMIPIGGIQMVQARPSTHSSLVPNSVVSLQAGYFAPGGNGSSSFTEFSQAQERGKEPQIPQESSPTSVSPAAKISKYTLSPEVKSSGYSEEKLRTSELQQKTEQEEYRFLHSCDPDPAIMPCFQTHVKPRTYGPSSEKHLNLTKSLSYKES